MNYKTIDNMVFKVVSSFLIIVVAGLILWYIILVSAVNSNCQNILGCGWMSVIAVILIIAVSIGAIFLIFYMWRRKPGKKI